MTRYFITRHPGALEWATDKGLYFDQHLTHVSDVSLFEHDDIVAGTLPVNLVAELCALGVHYYHLALELPESLRGIELTAEQLVSCNASLKQYVVLEWDLI